MARFARAPSRPSAVLPRSAAAPRGRSPLGGHRPCPFRCRSTGETSDWPLWISPPACWGSGTKCRGGAVRRTAGKLQGVSWLASLAPPPGFRPYSPVSLPLHGGEVLWEVIVRARFAAAPRGRRPTGLFGFLPQLAGGVARSAEGARSAGPLGNSRVSHGSLRSRPLPAFGRTPPFRCRSTGAKSFGKSSSVPVSLALHGGDVRLASLDFSPSLLGEWHEVPRGRGPQDRWETPGCLMARFARAPSRPSAVLPRFAAAPRGRSPLGSHRPCPFRCRSNGGETIESPVLLPLHGGEVLWTCIHMCMQVCMLWGMASTSVRIDRSTHDELKELARSLGTTVGDTVAIAVKGLRQEMIGQDLRRELSTEDTEWLDADLG